MSFRTRLTSFFLLIVAVPMVAIGVLVFRLISDSEQGKADARAAGISTAAASLYANESAAARADAATLARNPVLFTGGPALSQRLSAIASQAGLARITVRSGQRMLADVGVKSALAPGSATVILGRTGREASVSVSELTAAQYTHDLAAPGAAIVVRMDGNTLDSSVPAARGRTFPRRGTVTVAGVKYKAVTQPFQGFGGAPVAVTVLSDLSATSTSVNSSRVIAAAFIAGFLLLAFSFSVLASRALQGQLARFLGAARRLAGGDFSAPVPIEGRDEFAALGEEFNNMSSQLERRLDELSQERGRLREAIHRIGQTFAANLDRPALLGLALKTAVDAVQASAGRVSVRSDSNGSLAENVREGSVDGLEQEIYEAEKAALKSRALAEAGANGIAVASVPLGPSETDGRAHGLITVARRGRLFTDDDREVLRSLAAQTTLALENVELHVQVSRQAVTDRLTGLANHGRFQELLGAEMEQVRRYRYAVGLIMLDIDNFKSINDTYGHPQGDVVLRQVANVLQDNSREPDTPARYGGEEMALILPHTDLEGSHAIAERIRIAIEALRVPRLDQQGVLRITASLGVTSSTDGHKEALIADADAALYAAKRRGKNRTVRAPARAANVLGAE